MIQGAINQDREAIVNLSVRGQPLTWQAFDFVLDTGFSEYLSLPMADITMLGLSFLEPQDFVQSDGSILPCDVYIGTVLWDGQEQIVPIQCSEGDRLLGMALLHDHDVFLEVTYQGSITITARP